MWFGKASIYLMTGFRCCRGVRRSTDLHAATMVSSLLSCFCKLWHALGTIAEGATSPSNSGHWSLSISFLMSADSTGTGVVSSSCTCWSITRPVEGDCWDGSISEIHLVICNANPWFINPGWLIVVVPPNNSTGLLELYLPQINSLGFIIQGLTLQS